MIPPPTRCTAPPQPSRGFRKAFSFEPVIKTPFDLLKHLAVWQLQVSNKKSKGGPNGERKELRYTRCNCKYHIVFVPKYRRQMFYREKRRATGSILRKLCEWKSVRILEAECCADYIHMLVEIPPKMSVSGFMGYLKGKSSLMLYEQFGYLKFKYRNRAFWCRGYYVDTVGKNSRIFLNEYKPQMVKQTSPPRISVACIAREHAVVIKTGVIG